MVAAPGTSRQTQAPAERQDDLSVSGGINTSGSRERLDDTGSRFDEVEKKDLSELLKSLLRSSQDLMSQVQNSSLPVEQRIAMINHPDVIKLMEFFQSTKLDPDPFLANLSQSAGKMVDNLFEQFQPIKLEYDLHVFREIHDAVLKREAQDRQQELDVVIAEIEYAIDSPYPSFV